MITSSKICSGSNCSVRTCLSKKKLVKNCDKEGFYFLKKHKTLMSEHINVPFVTLP